MKKLHIFIISSFLRPFVTTFFIVLFIGDAFPVSSISADASLEGVGRYLKFFRK